MKTPSVFIDVHHHFNPIIYSNIPNSLQNKIKSKSSEDLFSHLSFMRNSGIRKIILSHPVSFQTFSKEENNILCRKINEGFYTLIKKHKKLGAFSLLPFGNAINNNQIINELEYSLFELKLNGIMLPCSVIKSILSDKHFSTFLFSTLNKKATAVFLHPYTMEGDKNLNKSKAMLFNEITRSACELSIFQIPQKYSNIKFILPNGGGEISYYMSRIVKGHLHADLFDTPEKKESLKHMHDILKLFYYDMAFGDDNNMYHCLIKFAEDSKILWGSNFPESKLHSIEKSIEIIKNTYDCNNTSVNFYR